MLKLIDSFKVTMRTFITKSLLIYEDIIETKIINIQDLRKKYGEEYDKGGDYYQKALNIQRKVKRISSLQGGYYTEEESDEFIEDDESDNKVVEEKKPQLQKPRRFWLKKGSTYKTVTTSHTTLSEAERIGILSSK